MVTNTQVTQALLNERKITDWPFPIVDNLWYAGMRTTWVEVSADIYDDQLGSVFPEVWKDNAFMVGEAWDEHPEKGFIHAVFVHLDGRFFCKNDYLRHFNPLQYTREIKSSDHFK